MGKTREIKKRIKAVGNIRRITKTMQMIATSKFARSQQQALAGKPYSETLFDLVTQLAAGLGDVTHPLLDDGKGAARPGKALTLVITSDRGLCGPYNGAVLRLLMQTFKSEPALKAGLVEVVGKKGASFLRFAGVPVSRHLTQFTDKIAYEPVRVLAEELIQRYLAGEVSSVRIVSTRYISAGRQSPAVMQLLPFRTREKAGTTGAGDVFEFSPAAAELLADLLPAAVKALLFQAFNDAIVSEHVARMVAMKSATDNAGKAGKRLTRVYNRARQAQITTELTEIISGAAALA